MKLNLKTTFKTENRLATFWGLRYTNKKFKPVHPDKMLISAKVTKEDLESTTGQQDKY